MGQKYYIEQGEGSEFLLDQLLHPSKSYLYAHAQIKSPSWLVICDLVVAIFAVIQVAKTLCLWLTWLQWYVICFCFCRSRLFRLLKFDTSSGTNCQSPLEESVNQRGGGYFRLTQDEVREKRWWRYIPNIKLNKIWKKFGARSYRRSNQGLFIFPCHSTGVRAAITCSSVQALLSW